MAKVKMVATLTYEYTADTDDYPADLTPEQMAMLDSNDATADIVAELGDLTVKPA